MLWYKTRFSTSWEGVIQRVANLAKLLGESAVDEQDLCRDTSPGKFAASSRTSSRNFSRWFTGSKQHLGRYFPKEQLPDERWVLCNFIQSSWWREETPPWKCSEISPMIALVWGPTGPPATPEGCWAPWVSQCPVTVARPPGCISVQSLRAPRWSCSAVATLVPLWAQMTHWGWAMCPHGALNPLPLLDPTSATWILISSYLFTSPAITYIWSPLDL